jgi:L-ascorbate metabolism protein UlaG (beta-lactamase superfamily)
MIKFSYFGHSCFMIDNGITKLLFDPYFTGNPAATVKQEDVDCQYIFVSHAHGDHLGDAALIAKRTGAMIIGVPEVLRLCQEQGCENVYGMNIGGSHRFPFGKVRMTTAIHSCGVAGGHACGFVVHFDTINIYFAGDTSLFSDMQIIGRKENIDYAILPIGDEYTMGMEDAAMAAQLLNARNVIPVHYNTWGKIAQNPEEYKQMTESMSRAEVHIVPLDGTLELK